MFATMPLDELPSRAHTLYVGCRDVPAINAILTSDDYDYENPDFEAGLALVEAVEKKIGEQVREYGEQYLATEAATLRLAELETTLVRHRELCRAKHKRGTAGYRALGLDTPVPDDDEALFATADAFYRSIENDPSLAEGVRGLKPAAIARGRAAVTAARDAMDAQTKETGEAQLATRRRDDEVVKLRAHAAELAKVCKVALADEPQLREQAGLRERS